MTTTTRKTCARCHVDQPVNNFHPSPRSFDGIDRLCKKCAQEERGYNAEDRCNYQGCHRPKSKRQDRMNLGMCAFHTKLGHKALGYKTPYPKESKD